MKIRLVIIGILCAVGPGLHAEDWPQFRGPKGAGVVAGSLVPPDRWTTKDNVSWNVEVPGQGWSCPIVVGNRVYLTSCKGPEKVVSPKTGYYAPLDCKTSKGEHQWVVHCLDATTGKTIWEKPFLTGEANMSHTLANLEYHHFKYAGFRRPGDVHIHFFGTATLSIADGIVTEDGDKFEISAPAFGAALRNRLKFAKPDYKPGGVKSL
jgi:outer membrane protein assembly factor BamB